jgi:hypothetical protein
MRASLVAALALLAGCRSPAPLEPTPPERTDMTPVARAIPPHEPVPGSTARTALIFKERIVGLAASVEIREYYVSGGEELAVTSPSEALFEVRSGIMEMTTQNEQGERRKGAMWTALPGERVAVRTTSEMAILRATYVIKD